MARKKQDRSEEDQAGLEGLGKAVRELREKKGWDQHELADRVGLHFTSIYAVERGAVELTWGNLRRFAGGLEVDLNTLLELAEALAPGEGGERWRRWSWAAGRGVDLG
jgi:transcriptional regulator with XRE-family HTH domain